MSRSSPSSAAASRGLRPHAVIIGGGIIGISTALSLLDHPVTPYRVTVIADDFPSLDPTTYTPNADHPAPASFASAWAGAHHVSDARTERQLDLDKTTYRVISLLDEKLKSSSDHSYHAKGKEEALIKVHQVEYWQRKADFDEVERAISWYPNYRPLPPSSLPEGVEVGCTFETYDFVVPHYLPCLYRLFQSLGGVSIREKVKSIDDLVHLSASSSSSSSPDAVIVSPGLGARELLGDNDVHPVRGQTVLVRAPWCTTAASQQQKDSKSWALSRTTSCPEWTGMSRVNASGFRDMYVLPRGDGTFIVGGTRLPHVWDDAPREETTAEIVQRALQFMPGLARPQDGKGAVDDNKGKVAKESPVDIVGVNVGLRPSRSSGVRLERAKSMSIEGAGEITVIYSYGYGGFGYQCSWGAAFAARDLVDDALQRPRAPPNSTIKFLDEAHHSQTASAG